MVEPIYKTGDVLEIPVNIILPRSFGMMDEKETCRCLVLDMVLPGYGAVTYVFLVHKDGFRTYNVAGISQKNIADCAVRIGHIDISLINYKEPEEANDLRLAKQILTKQRDQLRTDKNALLEVIAERDRTIKNLNDHLEALKKDVSEAENKLTDLNRRLGDEISGKRRDHQEGGGI